MSVEGKNFDGDMSDEKLIITYKRRGVYNESPNPQEVGTSLKRKKKAKEKDIGWFHGEMLNGIKQHWRCNYCGMTRRGGGVTRLKLHLVGRKDVRKCPYVPDHVVEKITRNLYLKEKEITLVNLNWNGKKRRKGISRAGPSRLVKEGEVIVKEEVDDMDSDASGSENDDLEKNLEDNVQHFSLSCMSKRHECTNHEVPKNPDEIMHYSNTKADMPSGTGDETERHAQVGYDAEYSKDGNHWKSWKCILESMLPLPDRNENRDGNGIESSSDSGGLHGCIREALSQHQSRNTSQVVVRENVRNCQNALVSILNSDKFALLCDLLRSTFEDENPAGRNYFNFGKIDAKMKNGDYEKAPHQFSNDIRKFWKSFEHVGQEMVHLAASLSSISRTNIENEVGIHESDVDQPIDPYQSHYCNHCQYEITNNWGLISCKGCDTFYHTSCINPLIHGSTKSWFCSACIGKKPDLPVTSVIDDTDSDKEGNSEMVHPCITSIYRLCKICGVRTDRQREFLVCSHPECPYKYYHMACLKKSQINVNMQEDSICWFCPSCLCRVCQRNQDDPLLVLCDGCDEAYHIYCMDPPCDSVPKGKWYCGKCTTKRRRERGKRENLRVPVSRRFKKNGGVTNLQINDDGKNEYKKEHQSMDLLMNAIDFVSAQEKPPS